jgi:hypothetical protein
VALAQPERSELNSTAGGTAPIASLADAHTKAPPGAVWLTVCAWCGRTNGLDGWTDDAHGLDAAPGTRLQMTHSICPSCFDDVQQSA